MPGKNAITPGAAGEDDAPWYGALEFRTLAETVPALLFVTNRSGHAVYTNSAYQRYAGAAPESLLGLGFLKVVHPDDRVRALALWEGLSGTAEPYEIEHRIRRHDGSFRWHQVRGAPVLDKDGTVLRWIGVCTDIQDLRSAVAEAQDTNELLAVIGRSTDAIVFAKDEQGRFVFANEATLQVMEAGADRVIGTSAQQAARIASEAQSIDANDARVIETGEMIVVEERWTTRAGVPRVYRSTKGPWRRSDGSVGIVGITTDVTRELNLVAEINEAERVFRNVYDSLPYILWLTDSEGKLIVRNNMWQDYTGLPDRRDYQLAFIDLIEPADYRAFADEWDACVTHHDVLETTVRLRDILSDQAVYHKIVAVPVHSAQGLLTGWVGSAIPVSDPR